LRIVLEVLRENGLYAKLKGQVAFLAYVLSNEEVSVDPQKIGGIIKWPRSKNPMELRSFLGLAGYYRRFVQNFSKIATPLTKLTRKVVKYEWTNCYEEILQELKKRLMSAPILALPTNNKDFVMYSDVV